MTEEIQTFQSLSSGDKFRVYRFLASGKAPTDSRLAVVAVEVAETYQRQGRIYKELLRWMPALLFVGLVYPTLPAAIDGGLWESIFLALIFLGGIAQLMFNPTVRPSNLGRSLEASRRVVASAE